MRITNKSLFQGLKDMVFLVIMFNTCITQIIVRKEELTKKVDISKNCTILQRFGGSKIWI